MILPKEKVKFMKNGRYLYSWLGTYYICREVNKRCHRNFIQLFKYWLFCTFRCFFSFVFNYLNLFNFSLIYQTCARILKNINGLVSESKVWLCAWRSSKENLLHVYLCPPGSADPYNLKHIYEFWFFFFNFNFKAFAFYKIIRKPQR